MELKAPLFLFPMNHLLPKHYNANSLNIILFEIYNYLIPIRNLLYDNRILFLVKVNAVLSLSYIVLICFTSQ